MQPANFLHYYKRSLGSINSPDLYKYNIEKSCIENLFACNTISKHFDKIIHQDPLIDLTNYSFLPSSDESSSDEEQLLENIDTNVKIGYMPIIKHELPKSLFLAKGFYSIYKKVLYLINKPSADQQAQNENQFKYFGWAAVVGMVLWTFFKIVSRTIILIVETTGIILVQTGLFLSGSADLMANIANVFIHNRNIEIANSSNNRKKALLKAAKILVIVILKGIALILKIVSFAIILPNKLLHIFYNLVGTKITNICRQDINIIAKVAVAICILGLIASVLLIFISAPITLWVLAITTLITAVLAFIYIIPRDYFPIPNKNRRTVTQIALTNLGISNKNEQELLYKENRSSCITLNMLDPIASRTVKTYSELAIVVRTERIFDLYFKRSVFNIATQKLVIKNCPITRVDLKIKNNNLLGLMPGNVIINEQLIADFFSNLYNEGYHS